MYYFDDPGSLQTAKEREIKIKGVYKHFKGNLYIVKDIAINSETGEEMVVYRSLGDGTLYVRPKKMFLSIKKTEEGYTHRFARYEV